MRMILAFLLLCLVGCDAPQSMPEVEEQPRSGLMLTPNGIGIELAPGIGIDLNSGTVQPGIPL